MGTSSEGDALGEALELELECAICRAVMTDPRVLACQHCFCLRCIDMSSDRAKVAATPHGGNTDGSDSFGIDPISSDDESTSPASPAYDYASLTHAAGAAGSSIVTIKCPYNCGTTEVPDIRSLPKSPIISNMCRASREKTYRRLKANGEAQMCDICSAESCTHSFCEKCTTVMCKPCGAGDAHSFFCGVQQRIYPFVLGLGEAEKCLRKSVSISCGIPESRVRVKSLQRVQAPCHLLRVASKLKIGGIAECTSTTTSLALLDDTLLAPGASSRQTEGALGETSSSSSDSASSGSPISAVDNPRLLTDAVQRGGADPLTSSQLETLCKLQDVKLRQIRLFEVLGEFLSTSPCAAAIRAASAEVHDLQRWDGGLSNDCAALLDALLSLHRHLCSPLSRKIRLLATLEGLHQSTPGGSTVSPAVLRQLRKEMGRHLDLVGKSEAALDSLSEREQQLFASADSSVQTLLAAQHEAFQRWQRAVDPVHVSPDAALLHSGPTLRFAQAAPGNGSVVTRLCAGGTASFPMSPASPGAHSIELWYSSPEGSRLSLSVVQRRRGGGAAPPVTLDLPPTDSWDTFAVARVPEAVVLGGGGGGGAEVVAHLVASFEPRVLPDGTLEDPPDISRVTLQRTSRGGGGVAEAGGGALRRQGVGASSSFGTAAASSAADAALHSEVLVVLGYCHQTQIDILTSLEDLYAQVSWKYWGGPPSPDLAAKERAIEAERKELLSLMKQVMQVRIFQRQYHYCVREGMGLQAPDGVVPLPVTVTRPSKRLNAETLPNLLQTIQPKIHEFRGQQGNLEVPQHHMQQQIRGVLCQTLDLLHREQVLHLREGAQEANAHLMFHVASGCVTALSDTRNVRDFLSDTQALSDLHDLQVIQMLWGRLVDPPRTATALQRPSRRGATSPPPPPPPPPARPGTPRPPARSTAGHSPSDHPPLDPAAATTQRRQATETDTSQAVSPRPQLGVGERLLESLLTNLTRHWKVVIAERGALQCPVRDAGSSGVEDEDEDGVGSAEADQQQHHRGGPLSEAAAETLSHVVEALDVQRRITQSLLSALHGSLKSPSCFRKVKLLSRTTVILRRLQRAWATLIADYREALGHAPTPPKDSGPTEEDLSRESVAGGSAAPPPLPHPSSSPSGFGVEGGVEEEEEGTSTLEWFSQLPQAHALGMLEECFGGLGEDWWSGGLAHPEPAVSLCTDRAALRRRAIQAVQRGAGKSGLEDPRLLLLVLLHAPLSMSEAVDVAHTHEVHEPDFQTVVRIPFYKGVYTVLPWDSAQDLDGCEVPAYPFVVDGQEGKLFLEHPPRSSLRSALCGVTACLAHPVTWVVLNAFLIGCSVACNSRRAVGK